MMLMVSFMAAFAARPVESFPGSFPASFRSGDDAKLWRLIGLPRSFAHSVEP
jgi:hypothetical protein